MLAREAAAVAKPDPEPVDDVLDDGVDGAGRVAERASRQPSSARLVPREASAVDQEHLRPPAREAERRRRARGAGADDDDVEALHVAIVGAGRPRESSPASEETVTGLFRRLFRKPQPAGPPEVIRRFDSSARTIARSGVTVDGESFRIDSEGEGSVPLFEVADPRWTSRAAC